MQVVIFKFGNIDAFISFNQALASRLSPFYTLPNANGSNAWQTALEAYLGDVFLAVTGKGVSVSFISGAGNAGTLQVTPQDAGAFETQYSFVNSSL